MILWTKYLDNLRPCTKQVKNDTEKQWKKFCSRWLKNHFGFTLNRIESYHPEHLLVYYKFFKKLKLCRTYSISGIGLLQDPPFYCKSFMLVENSIRRLLLLKLVLHSLLSMLLMTYDPIRPTQTHYDWYPVVTFAFALPSSYLKRSSTCFIIE